MADQHTVRRSYIDTYTPTTKSIASSSTIDRVLSVFAANDRDTTLHHTGFIHMPTQNFVVPLPRATQPALLSSILTASLRKAYASADAEHLPVEIYSIATNTLQQKEWTTNVPPKLSLWWMQCRAALKTGPGLMHLATELEAAAAIDGVTFQVNSAYTPCLHAILGIPATVALTTQNLAEYLANDLTLRVTLAFHAARASFCNEEIEFDTWCTAVLPSVTEHINTAYAGCAYAWRDRYLRTAHTLIDLEPVSQLHTRRSTRSGAPQYALRRTAGINDGQPNIGMTWVGNPADDYEHSDDDDDDLTDATRHSDDDLAHANELFLANTYGNGDEGNNGSGGDGAADINRV